MTNEKFDLMDRRPENDLSTNKPQQAEELFTLDDLIADILEGFTPDSEPKDGL